jgi:hypothetical protein
VPARRAPSGLGWRSRRSGQRGLLRIGWLNWLKENCPDIGERQDRRYRAFAQTDVNGRIEDQEQQWRIISGNVSQDERAESLLGLEADGEEEQEGEEEEEQEDTLGGEPFEDDEEDSGEEEPTAEDDESPPEAEQQDTVYDFGDHAKRLVQWFNAAIDTLKADVREALRDYSRGVFIHRDWEAIASKFHEGGERITTEIQKWKGEEEDDEEPGQTAA